MGIKHDVYLRRKKEIESTYLTDNTTAHTETLFWEIHGGISLPSFNDDIWYFRSLAQKHNKTFFAFTILREGPSAAISYFNFYCPPCEGWQFPKSFNNTEQDFVGVSSVVWSNYQSRLLFHGNYGHEFLNSTIKAENATQMYENSELDWIGTTNTLSETTIPLLDYLINGQTQKKYIYSTWKGSKWKV